MGRSNSLVHRLQHRQRRGHLQRFWSLPSTPPVQQARRAKMFEFVPARLQFQLCSSAPPALLATPGALVLGFSWCGRFVLVLQQRCTEPTGRVAYHLQWWAFDTFRPWRLENQVALFANKSSGDELQVEIVQQDASFMAIKGEVRHEGIGTHECFIDVLVLDGDSHAGRMRVQYQLDAVFLSCASPQSCHITRWGEAFACGVNVGNAMQYLVVDLRPQAADADSASAGDVAGTTPGGGRGEGQGRSRPERPVAPYAVLEDNFFSDHGTRHCGPLPTRLRAFAGQRALHHHATRVEALCRGQGALLRVFVVRFDAEQCLVDIVCRQVAPRISQQCSLGVIHDYDLQLVCFQTGEPIALLLLHCVVCQRDRSGNSLPATAASLLQCTFLVAVHLENGRIILSRCTPPKWVRQWQLTATARALSKNWRQQVTLPVRRIVHWLSNAPALAGKSLTFVRNPVLPVAITL